MSSKRSSAEKLKLKELISIGVGGMVGGGIFSVLGLAAYMAGHAAPVAFALGGIVALITGLSYAKLGLAFRSDGGSFTYLEHAFKNRNVAGIGGWLLLVGYIGTLALYSYTFGIYGAAMFGEASKNPAVSHFLESFILLLFMGINLYGVKAAGETEDVIVMVKVLILSLFAVVGLVFFKTDHFLPVFNKSAINIFMGAALIFVAYEGFELIPNAVNEMKNPSRDLPRGIFFSICITTGIYILVSLVAVANLTPVEISKYKEYALAVAAKPFLGHMGFLLIGIGALLSTASAINATLFGTARLGMIMAQESTLPRAFSHKERTKDIPWVSLLVITAITLVFVNVSNLAIISSFASSVFLMIFASINLSAYRLKDKIGITPLIPVTGLVLTVISWIVLSGYLWEKNRQGLLWIIGCYVCVIVAELLFSKRKLKWRKLAQ